MCKQGKILELNIFEDGLKRDEDSNFFLLTMDDSVLK